MPYVGRELVRGQNRELDDISSSFNSGNTAFTMQVGGVTTTAASVNQVFISLGGVMQHPGTDYTVSSSTLTFTTAPASGLAFWGLIQGDQLNTGTPADGTVGSSKFASGDLTFPSDITIPDKIIHTGDTNTSIRFPAADTITGETGGTERIRIDSSGRILKGLTTARGNYGNNTSGVEYEAQIEGTSATSSTLAIVRNSNDANDGGIVLGKTRSATTGGNTVVQASDDLGNITFAGSDGTTLQFGAEIIAQVEAGVGDDDMPTSLIFKTNAGSTSTTERLRIAGNGLIGIGGTPNWDLDVHGSNTTINVEATGWAQLRLTGGSTENYITSDDNLSFYVGGTEKVFINTDGSVGIGTDDPRGSSTYVGLELSGTTGGVITFSDEEVEKWNLYGEAASFGVYDRVNARYNLKCLNDGDVQLPTGNLKVSNSKGITALGVDNSTYGELDITVAALDGSGTNNVATFKRGSNSVINLAFPSGGGIDFSATGGPTNGSGTSEILDDYEEGTWTPTFGSGITVSSYSEQSGFYVKIGRQVWAQFYLKAAAGSTTDSNNLEIHSLPFTSSNTARTEGGGFISYNNGFLGANDYIYTAALWVNTNNTKIQFHRMDSGVILAGSDTVPGNKYIIGAVIYQV